MTVQDRKALVAAWKQRPRRAGVYAVRCAPTGQDWVASAPEIDRREAGLWFTLRLGSHPNRALQAAWNAHGAAAFRWEVLESFLVEDMSEWELGARLKSRERRWREALGAARLTG
jgi:hypothetical protein